MKIYSATGAEPRSRKSQQNSTVTPLTGGATFTGTGVLVDYPDVLVALKTDVAGTLYIEFSVDGGSNYDTSIPFKVEAGGGEFHTVIKGFRTCRVRYVNGAAAQTYLRLHTEFGTYRQANSPLNSAIQQDSDAATVRAITEELAIASGLFQGYSIVNKYGTNTDVDTGTVPEDICEGGGTYPGFPDSTLEAVEVLSDNAADTGAGTGARTVRLTGLDANYDVLQETVTLNGTTPVDTVGQFRRIHTATVVTAGSGGVNAGMITARHTTTTANVFIHILAGRNQSNCAAYTVPAGHTAYMRHLHASIRGSATATLDGYIWTRPFGGVFRVRRPFSVASSARLDDAIYGGLVFTEKSDIMIRIEASSANNVSVTGGYDLVLVKNA